MGEYRHHSIVVTVQFFKDDVEILHKKASDLGLTPSDIIETNNMTYSFFIPPDGLKEFRECSDNFDSLRKDFKNFFNQERFHCTDWVEVAFGGDFFEDFEIENFYGNYKGSLHMKEDFYEE